MSSITYVTAAMIKCMEVLYLYTEYESTTIIQVYSTKIFIFPAGGEWRVEKNLVCDVTYILEC
jgi:hypothetical protein